jgi:phosphoribosylglycinamide formyltransferase 2
VIFSNLQQALDKPDTQLRLFGKPEVKGERRMGVALARSDTIQSAIDKAMSVSEAVVIKFKGG